MALAVEELQRDEDGLPISDIAYNAGIRKGTGQSEWYLERISFIEEVSYTGLSIETRRKSRFPGPEDQLTSSQQVLPSIQHRPRFVRPSLEWCRRKSTQSVRPFVQDSSYQSGHRKKVGMH